jgi:hypothetical protein
MFQSNDLMTRVRLLSRKFWIPHPPTSPVGNGIISSGIKRPGREYDHSPPHNAEV